MKPTLSYEMHTIYTGAIYLKAVMAFHKSQHKVFLDGGDSNEEKVKSH